MIDNDILVYSIIHIRMVLLFSFFGNSYFLKIANGIIGDNNKQPIVDEFEFVFSDLNCSENS
jgi:hypothetical protein